MNTPNTLAHQLVHLLRAYGVDTVFGIPGVHTVALYGALAASGLQHVSARHEQSLGFMADGYARVCGQPGVCFVITGPGLTNIATAMAQAYADSIPMLVISGVNPQGRMGSGNGYLHELPDQRAFAQTVSAFSHTLHHPDELPQVLARAFAVFDGARARPVHIEIPLNLMDAPLSGAALAAARIAPVRLQRGAAAQPAVQQAATLLRAAQRPLLLVGGGALHAGAQVQALAEALDAPVVMTINARGLLPLKHPLAVSASPSFPAVRALADASDCLLAVGTEWGPTDYDCYDRAPYLPGAPLIRIDLDPQQLVRNVPPTVALLGDAQATLHALLREMGLGDPARAANLPAPAPAPAPTPTPASASTTASAASPGAQRAQAARVQGLHELDARMQSDLALLHALRDALPGALWVGDSTRMVYAGNMGFAAEAPRSWFNASVGFGALGYGLPAAVGAAHAAPGRTVVCLAGDGGLQFTLGELGTAMETGARLLVLLLNNRGYGEIKAALQAAGTPPLGVDLHTPDFVALARSYGWQAARLTPGTPGLENPAQWAQQVAALRAQAVGPVLVELQV